MAIIEAIVGPVSKLLDKIIPDPEARDRAKLELIRLQGEQEMAAIGAQMQAIVVEAQSADIDVVSGATVTWEGYTESLQAAIDQAHL